MASPVQDIEALTKAGNWTEASALSSKLCSKLPNDARLWRLAADIELRLGHIQQALSNYRRATELDPESTGTVVEYGRALQVAGNPEQAISLLQGLVERAPDNAYAHQMLGELFFRQGHFNNAKQRFEEAHKLKPDMLQALLGLSNVWNALERHDEVITYLKKAISIEPRAYELHYNLGLALKMLNRFEEAYLACCDTLGLKPDYVPAVALQASIRERQGRYKEAMDLLDPLIRRGESHLRVVDAFVSLCHRVGRCEEAIALSRKVCSSGNDAGTSQDLMCLYFSTGRALDRIGRYDEAFANFRNANQLRNANSDVTYLQRTIDTIISVQQTDPVSQQTRHYVSEPKLIFIVGMPRSGTTLVEQILASHPDVYGAGELNTMPDIANSIAALTGASTNYPHCMNELDEDRLVILRKAYLSRLPDACRGAAVVTDKQPGNFLLLGLIRALFPNAAVVHCTRNPLDTCLSCYFNNFIGLPYTYDLTALGKAWREYKRLMLHWETLSIPMFQLSYESLVDDVESMSRKLIDYCGLGWKESCLKFHEHDRVVSTASYDQVSLPIYRGSVDRWRNYETHIEALITALKG